MSSEKSISAQTLKRLPMYLEYLKGEKKRGETTASARSVAEALNLGEVQVRKDLAQVSDGGKPKVGYVINELIADINEFLGYNNTRDAVLVGAGKLGQALMSYDGFRTYGLNIIAAFDTDPEKVTGNAKTADDKQLRVAGKSVMPIEKLSPFVRRMNVRIGIITVPASAAQEVCDLLVSCGVLAIWNFAPAHVTAPEGILVKSENMASSLALLSKHLEAIERGE